MVLPHSVDEVRQDDDLDAVLVVLVATGVTDATEAVRELTAARAGAGADKPLLLVTFGGVVLPEAGTPGITVLPSLDDAVDALSRVAGYDAWRRLPLTDVAPTDARNHPSSVRVPKAWKGTSASPALSSSQRRIASFVSSTRPLGVRRPMRSKRTER